MTTGETRAQLIEWLVAWREQHKGSRSRENNRANLETWTTDELCRRVQQIREHEATAEGKA